MSAQSAILAAVALPLAGALLIALAGRAPNLREGVTLATAVSLFAVVATLYPAVAAGARPGVTLFALLPGMPFAFAVEPLGLLFALVASGLWILNSLYSIGYMRGNDEHHQTRFYVCFAGAIAATVGVAFAANGLTLFFFYEMLTLVTYPLVTHHGTDEARRAGRVYLGVLLDDLDAVLPARADRDLAGRRHARLPARRHPRRHGRQCARRRSAGAVHVRDRQGGADAVPSLAAGGDGGADAGERAAACGGRGQGGRVHRREGDRLRLRRRQHRRTRERRLAAHGRRVHDHRGVDRRAARGQSEAPARLFDGEPAVLRGARGRAADAVVGHRRGAAHRRARVRQDHAVLRRRRDLHRRAQDRSQPARRDRAAHAVDDGRVRRRRAVDDRIAADRRFRRASGSFSRARTRPANGCPSASSPRARCCPPAICCPSCTGRSSSRAPMRTPMRTARRRSRWSWRWWRRPR